MHFDANEPLPQRGKVFGVMARAGQMTGTDPLWLRVGAVVALCVAFKLALALYCVAAVAVRMRRA